jgi:iron complex transport system permease protein
MILLSLAGVLSAMCVLSISVGSSGLSVAEILKTLLGGGMPSSRTIVWNVRMPRIAAGVSVGIALAMAGCVMQNVLRNPLSSASTLGVAQGASFGAAFAIVYLGAGIQVNAGTSAAITVTNPYLIAICAFLGGIGTTIVILGLSRVSGVTPPVMILAGVALSSLFTGATTLIQYFADDVMISTVVYWTFGSLGRAGLRESALIFFLGAAAFLYFIYNRWNYNALESGTHTAKSLGVPVDRLILTSMAVCALISSVAVAFVGTINFIGLIAPHMVRRFVGNDYRYLIPGSALMGAALMLASDVLSRVLIAPAVLPIGALTSFLGAPLFLYMILEGNLK